MTKPLCSFLVLATLALSTSSSSQDLGVLCRFNGQIDPASTLDLWNDRWDTGSGVTEVNNDCEAIVFVGSNEDRQWVGSVLSSSPSYLRTRLEVGREVGFAFPDEGLPILEVTATDLPNDQPVPYLFRMVMGHSETGGPDAVDLLARWADDLGQYSRVLGPFEMDSQDRLLIRFDWYSSNDEDKDFVPEKDGLIRLWVNEELLIESSELMIDAVSPTEVRFGHLNLGGEGAEGVLYFRPLGVHLGFHDAWEE